MVAAPTPKNPEIAGALLSKPAAQAAKLVVETAPQEKSSLNSGPATVIADPSRPEPINSKENSKSPALPATPATKGRLGSLNKIRAGIANDLNCKDEKSVIALNDDKLLAHWNEYAQLLRERKNPAVQSFDMAKLVIHSENNFEVITNNNLEQKFIDQEKRELSEFLQKEFCNKFLNFSISIGANPHYQEDFEKPVSKKDQFIKIVEEFPLVKEVKDRLRLELDY